MPYLSIKQAKQDNLALYSAMGGKLALMNIWGGYYDEALANKDKEPAIVAWLRFKEKYQKVNNEWIRKEA